MLTILLLALSASLCYPTLAHPLHLVSRANSASGSKPSLNSPRTWIPIVIVVVMIIVAALVTWFKKYFRNPFPTSGIAHARAPLGVRGVSTSVGREITAEQLIGDSVTNLPATRQPYRTRRPRRTPSQVSVTSLPAYNKEPGDEELVIFRSRDMEDVTILSATVAEEEDSSLNSHDRSQVSTYAPVSTTATNEMPLLHDDHPSGDISLSTLATSDARRPSSDPSLHETSSLMRVDSNLPDGSPDPRGETPAYFEVVDLSQEPFLVVPTTQTSSVPSTSPSQVSQQRRRSGFRTFLDRMTMMSHVPEHRRTESDQSVTSDGHRSNRSTPNRPSNHRPSQSSSGTSMFRTISRQKSTQTLNSSVRLNSPSLISLNSISSPLSHTLIRTEFTYPKSGPTPEQLKVISSRENFSRFGVPYGPDAIAFAASSSRPDLEPPPPDFEVSTSQLSLIRPVLSSPSAAGDIQRRPSISSPVLDGQVVADDGPRSSEVLSQDKQPENVPRTSTPPTAHIETSASPSTSNVADPISTTSTSTSTSTSTHAIPTPINEFGQLHPSSLAPQDATGRSESRASNYSIQSYATAPESLLERMGHAK